MSGPLRLHLLRSSRLAGVLIAAHAAAAAALWIAPVPWPVAVAVAAVLAANAVWCVRGHAFRSAPSSVIELELARDGTLSAHRTDGTWTQYRIVGSSFVSRVLTVLNLRNEASGRVRSVLITADAVDADGFRRMRVWLRWRSPAATPEANNGK
jgi:toxin CptA